MCDTRPLQDADPQETEEWLDSLDDLLHRWGPERVRFLLARLQERARIRDVAVPFHVLAPAVNTIGVESQPPYPGDVALEERIEAFLRWNAMATVAWTNKHHEGLGGHIASYASMATLYEVGFQHFFRGRDGAAGDQVYFQGHASPGIYARAYLEGRLSERDLRHFRQETAEGGGLSSYPHPWLMPTFWQFPTVSLGLGPITAVYQARFNRYLLHRGIRDTSGSHVWAFLGDGEVDEPEVRGAIDIAAREHLDNLTFVVNCNLQRLDGPVRGNGSIVRELEGAFRGAGWNVIKVLWSSGWDELFELDEAGVLVRHLDTLVDGELQKFSAESPTYMREELFGDKPELQALIEGWSDEKLATLIWGGHDRLKVHAAYRAALAHRGEPTVVLAQTVKGWGMGTAGKAKNRTHQIKKLKGDAILWFRDQFDIPLNDEAALELPLLPLPEGSSELGYLQERRRELGGYLPRRTEAPPSFQAPPLEFFKEYLGGSEHPASTTMALVRMLSQLLRHPDLGKLVVPIIPDEARTFGMESFFRQFGIYSPVGQLYEPVDRETFLYYREARDGQVLEEGITEAGAMSSFVAAGTAYATHGVNTIPFYIYYSMFGFQRVGDLIWLAGDARCRGFLVGATAGRTTLNGEGLQHQDGNSHLLAAPYPTVKAYDPAYAYETAVVVQDGLKRMYEDGEPWVYYVTVHNENYAMPAMLEGTQEGILAGLYRLRPGSGDGPRAQLFGSGSILREVLRGADILAERYGVVCDVWSATSYKQLRTDAQVAERWNRRHPDQAPRSCYLWDTLQGVEGPFVAASDYVALVPEQIAQWVPGKLHVLGTDGFGRSDTRERLRRHFEVDAENVVVMTLHALADDGKVERKLVQQAMTDLGLDPDQPDALFA